MTADLVVANSRIRTLDNDRPAATAVAITNGMISAVGNDADIRPLIGPKTEVIDGRELAIVPGLTVSHFHPFWGAEATQGVDLTRAKTLDDLRTLLRAERQRIGPGAWVNGWGLTFEMFQETGIRGDTFADAVDGGLAYLAFFDGHTAVVSPAAIAIADVTGRETFLDFSMVVVDEDGVPTGELREGGAMALVRRVMPNPTAVDKYRWYLEAMRKWNAVGLIGIHAMDGSPETFDLLREMEARGDLSVRMTVPLWQHPEFSFEQMRDQLSCRDVRGELWRGGVAKFFIDGVIESGTGWLIDPDTKGMGTEPFWPEPARYQEAVRIFAEAGFQCATHACGDMAVRCALDAYQRAGAAEGIHHRIEHVEILSDQDLPRFAQLGVTASMQPLHMNAFEPDGSDEWGLRAGPERRKQAFRTRDLLESGATLALGSDWMVASYDPRIGMAWARSRRPAGMQGRGLINGEQALTGLETLAGYTTAAAMAVSEEHLSGKIKVGYRGDLTAFAADPVDTDPDELIDLPVLLTVVNGRVVHRVES
ncbi:MAG TPA: amidohydrolase [Thermomicrobiales bacterium]|nr:amidohydrolase [Thermomicrobiales bacterium]